MVLSFIANKFVATCTFEERSIPKEAGFFWHVDMRRWVTTSPSVAARLREYADQSAKAQLNRTSIIVSPWTGRLTWPDTLTPKEFQKHAVQFALSRNRAYLALDPGLGKTIIMALILNARPTPTIVVCPPHLQDNTIFEFGKWAPKLKCLDLKTWRASITRNQKIPTPDVLVVPDSVLAQPNTIWAMEVFIARSNEHVALYVDEAHRFKNFTAKRTKALFGPIFRRYAFAYFFSGTPMPNRPIELFPVLQAAAPETIDYMNYQQFGLRYCEGHQGPWGWDFTGASNTGELFSRVKDKFMLRVTKAQALPELPEKTEEAVILSDDLPTAVARLERTTLRDVSPEDLMSHLAANGHVMTYRHELGKAKAPLAVKFIEEILDDNSEENLLVFAIHKEVIAELRTGLSKHSPIVIDGSVPVAKRNQLVNDFQNGAGRLFIGNITACGTGFTLTKASRVVFVEFAWSPGDNDQASDRAHRIGQHDNVFIQYLVFKNSLDRSVLDALLRKRETISQL